MPEVRADRPVMILLLLVALLPIAIGIFAYGTVLGAREQAERTSRVEAKARVAVVKSAIVASKTAKLTTQDQRVQALAIENCHRLEDYLSNARETRSEGIANALAFNTNSAQLAAAFAQHPGWETISTLFAQRAVLDNQRAHIAGRSRNELAKIVSARCDLPIAVK